MFCPKCGQQIPDDAKFCAICGHSMGAPAAPAAPAAPTYAAPNTPPAAPYAPPAAPYGAPAGNPYAAPRQTSPTIANFVAVLKEFFVSPVATVAKAAKSTSHEWSLLAAIAVVAYALGSAVLVLEAFTSEFFYFNSGISIFFKNFFVNILVGGAFHFGLGCGLWLLVSQIFKKNVNIIQCFNMVAVASLPLAAISIANMLFGLIYIPLTSMFETAAFAMTTICLYTGLQKFDRLEKSPFYGFSVVMAASLLVAFLFSLIG